MNRVSKIKRLKEIETNIEHLENYKVGIDSRYFNKGFLLIDLETTEFQYKDKMNPENGIEFDKLIMLNFIESQIVQYKKESKEILELLLN